MYIFPVHLQRLQRLALNNNVQIKMLCGVYDGSALGAAFSRLFKMLQILHILMTKATVKLL